jgi:MFS family permease
MTSSRSFLLICTVGIFCFISYNMVRMPVLALFAEQLGASPERIGLIVSVSTLTGVLLKLPSGALSDIYGRRMLLRIGVVAFGLPPFFYPFITDLNSLTALRFVHGLATAIFAPSALATVAELYRERRGAALGTYTACTQSGSLLGPFLGGSLAYAIGFNWSFVTAGLFGCMAIVLFYSLHLDVAAPRVKDKGVGPVLAEMWKGFVVVARNSKVLITSTTDAAKMIANGALMAFLPLYGVMVGLIYRPVVHVVFFEAHYGSSLRSYRPTAAHHGRVGHLCGYVRLYSPGRIVCGAFGAVGGIRFRGGGCILVLFRVGGGQFRVQNVGRGNGYAGNHHGHWARQRTAASRYPDRTDELWQRIYDHRQPPTPRGRVVLADDEE